jgi:cysteine desulfurase
MLYLDANATEPLRPAARQAALAAMALGGNPSSVHAPGRAARRVLETARESLAARLKARPLDIVFTSGATEANALAVHGLGAGRPILIGATEHDAIRAAAPDAVLIPVTEAGLVDLDVLDGLLETHTGALVCLMAANNETGVCHDIAGAAAICAAHGAVLHVDAVQAVGRAREDWLAMGAASLAISGHKCGGPMGAGALVLGPGVEIGPWLRGGGQELGRRGGTPALPAIAGMAAALDEPYDAAKIAGYRDEIEAFFRGLGGVVAGVAAPRLPNTACLAMPGLRADTQLIGLDLAGIAVSAGSACSSGKVAASHVLLAMGFGDLTGCAIRVSLPWNVTADVVPAFCAAYEKMLARASPRRRAAAKSAAEAFLT